MGTKYSHLSDSERWSIEAKLFEGSSYAAVGRALRRSRSTILREARRGRQHSATDRYLAEFARRYYRRKRAGAGLARRKLDADMLKPAWTTVLFGLRQQWSPQQLCDRLKDGMIPLSSLPAGVRTLSHETIYRAIYDMPPGQQRAALVKMLRRSRAGRRKHGRARRSFTGLQNMTPLSERPEIANLRLEPGHWEGDLIKGAYGRSAVGVLVDRFTRMTLLVKLSAANAHEVRLAFQARLRLLPAHMRLTLTYDRGTEMACHQQFTKSMGMPVYFCQAYSPWQRGTNENTNGLLRQYLPKGTDLSVHSRADLNFIERRLNGRPRRVLGRKTPQEVHELELLKFQQQARTRRAAPCV